MPEKTVETKPDDSTATIRLEQAQRFDLTTAVLGLDKSPDASRLYAACIDGVYELDVATGQHQRLMTHESYASGVVCLRREPLLVSAGYDGALQWFDLRTRAMIRRVQAHDFWSWRMAVSPDEQGLASVTGQYLAGGEKYEPAPEREPSVKLFHAVTGELRHPLTHVPCVQSVAFSPDSKFVAAGNLTGEIRVWDVTTGQLAAQWTTDAFTSWGIIKSHCYIGGVFALSFTPDGEHLLAAGMGPMRDPMAGNGRQLWQRFAWREQPPRRVDQTHEGESGEGLMETLALHPSGESFLMGGRLRGGQWNAAMFALSDGRLLTSLNTRYRLTGATFSDDGCQLFVGGGHGQPQPQDGQWKPFGVVERYAIN